MGGGAALGVRQGHAGLHFRTCLEKRQDLNAIQERPGQDLAKIGSSLTVKLSAKPRLVLSQAARKIRHRLAGGAKLNEHRERGTVLKDCPGSQVRRERTGTRVRRPGNPAKGPGVGEQLRRPETLGAHTGHDDITNRRKMRPFC